MNYFNSLKKIHLTNKFKMDINKFYKYNSFEFSIRPLKFKKQLPKRSLHLNRNKNIKILQTNNIIEDNNESIDTHTDENYSRQIERLILKDKLYDFFFENYKFLNQNHLVCLFKKIKEFNLHEEDRKIVSQIVQNLLANEQKITNSEIICEVIQIVLNFITHQDKTSSILLDTNSLINKKIEYFTAGNIKYVFQFYSCFFYKKTKLNVELWDNFLTNLLLGEKYFNVSDIHFFDLTEILNFCFKEKLSTNSLSDANFTQILNLLHDSWLNYSNSMSENAMVENLLEDELTLVIFEILYNNATDYSERTKFNKSQTSKNTQKQLELISEICLDVYKTLNLDLNEIMKKSILNKELDRFANCSDEEDNISMTKI